MTRRSFCKLFVIGFVSAIAGELESDDDDDGELRTPSTSIR